MSLVDDSLVIIVLSVFVIGVGAFIKVAIIDEKKETKK